MKLRQLLKLFQHPEAATPVKPAKLKGSSSSSMELEEGDLHDLTGSPLKCSFTLDDNLDLDVLPSTGKGRGHLSTLI